MHLLQNNKVRCNIKKIQQYKKEHVKQQYRREQYE